MKEINDSKIAASVENNHLTEDTILSQHSTVVTEAIKEMLETWDKISAIAKKTFPNITEDELYEIIKEAMNHAVGINIKEKK